MFIPFSRGNHRDVHSFPTRPSTDFPPRRYPPRRYPPNVVAAYNRLGLVSGASIEEVDKKRRELIKRYHPDRFSEPEQRIRAERITAEINAAHDAIERHLLRK